MTAGVLIRMLCFVLINNYSEPFLFIFYFDPIYNKLVTFMTKRVKYKGKKLHACQRR